MRDIAKLLLQHKPVSALFAVFVTVYIAQIFLVPINQVALDKYHLTTTQYYVTSLTIAIPYVAIWIIALVGYLRLKTYSTLLGKSTDGQAFRLISTGVLWFTIWLPLSTLIGAFGEYVYRDHAELMANMIRLQVYANLLLLIPAFIYIYQGSVRLLKVSRTRVKTSFKTTIGYIAFAALYTFVVLEDSARRVPIDANTPATYYMPDWLVMVSIVIPRLILWYLGVLAVQNIILYRQKIKGVIYRDALKSLATGLGAVTVLIIVLRCMQSLSNPFSKLNLAALLVIIYALLILMAVGYVKIAKGAKQLQTIEEA